MTETTTIIIEHPLRHMYYWNAKVKQKLIDSGYFDDWEPTDKDTLLKIMDEDLNDNVFKVYLDLFGSLNYFLKKNDLNMEASQKEALFKIMILPGFGPGYVSENPDGSLVPDPELREVHRIPEDMDIQEYMEREVLPKDELAWVQTN